MRRLLAFHPEIEVASAPDLVGHTFTSQVSLEPDELGPAILHVGGVATAYDVSVNGTVVAQGRSMFARHDVDVTQLLRASVNDVVVRCRPLADLLEAVPAKPRARWRTALCDDARLRWVRTSWLGRCSGIASGSAVVGPWRPVVLELCDPVRVTALDLAAAVIDGTGLLDVTATVAGAATVGVEVTGPTGVVSAELAVTDGVAAGRLELPRVACWWPHTHGAPTLYDVRILADGVARPLPCDGTAEAEPTRRRVGFRTIGNGSATGRPDTATASIDLHVNGVPVFCRGAVWTPGDLDALAVAVELGMNMVRVPGIAAYESDAFHERCDELGLLVWHDLMFATADVPLGDPGFAEEVAAEVRGELARLRGHASTVVVCGSAEHEQQAAMFGRSPADGTAGELAAYLRPLFEESGVDALWVASSPTGGALPFRTDVGIAQYFGVGGYRRGLDDVRRAGVRFASECLAFANLPDLPSGADPATYDWSRGVPRDRGADWDFADAREHYLPDLPPEEWLARAQQITGELMAHVFGEWRRPGSPCRGGLVLWLRDLEPGSGWGLLDHTGAPKPCARVLAPVLQPIALWLVDEGLNGLVAHVANDTEAVVGGVLRVELVAHEGHVVEDAQRVVEVPPRGHLEADVEDLLGHFADASYAYRFGPAAHAVVRAELRLDGATVLAEAAWSVAG